jgi:hypothetical protein
MTHEQISFSPFWLSKEGRPPEELCNGSIVRGVRSLPGSVRNVKKEVVLHQNGKQGGNSGQSRTGLQANTWMSR